MMQGGGGDGGSQMHLNCQSLIGCLIIFEYSFPENSTGASPEALLGYLSKGSSTLV